MIGAVLTQNTAWTNVEKAIARFDGSLCAEQIINMSMEELEDIIRPAGFFRQKSKYLKALTKWFASYNYNIDAIKARPLNELRAEILHIHGVGNETADSILLYALDLPSFVVDAYTMRLLKRYSIDAGTTYMQVKTFCETVLPKDAKIYNHFHALIVENGKQHCKKKPNCEACPLESRCKKLIS